MLESQRALTQPGRSINVLTWVKGALNFMAALIYRADVITTDTSLGYLIAPYCHC